MFWKEGMNLLGFGSRRIILCKGPLTNNYPFLSKYISSSGVFRQDNLNNSIPKVKNRFLAEERKKYEDTFGDIEGFELRFQRVKDDPEDIEEYHRAKVALGKTVAQYVKEIQGHIRNHDYKSAINILEIDMVNDKKPAVPYIYKLLISYNGTIGNLNEAYRLYIQYKKRQGLVSGGMYTSLFNACANCKNSHFALKKADAIKESLKNDKQCKVNTSNYNAMIKAYGRHGDLASALQIFDEVLERRDKVKDITYAFLFQACISVKNSGLRYALIIWRRMLQSRVKPSLYSFNLLLRCVRDCSFGETQLIDDLVKQIQTESQEFYRRKVVIKTVGNIKKRTVLKIPVEGGDLVKEENKKFSQVFSAKGETLKNGVTSDLEKENPVDYLISSQSQTGNLELVELASQEKNSGLLDNLNSSEMGDAILPNLLALKPCKGSVISFRSMTTPHHRFMCFGNTNGFLKVMAEFGIHPDYKTFTLLLDVVAPTVEAEEEVISRAHEHKVKLDAAFFNLLIKRRNLRREFTCIQDVLKMMQGEGVSPDIVTFGVLAGGCTSLETGLQLIEAARNFGIRLNSEILGALLWNAGKNRDLKYVNAVLQAAKEDDTKLSSKFIAMLGKIVRDEKRLRESNVKFDAIKCENGKHKLSLP